MLKRGFVFGFLGVLALAARPASAAAATLPNQTQTTTLTATLSEQADITVPAGIAFNVGSNALATNATASVSLNNIVLASAAKQMNVSLQANAANFTPPAGGVTWAASDVSWAAGTWANAAGTSGTLSDAAFSTVATSAAGATSMSTTGLDFTLAGKALVNRSGSHTLVITWKIESIGS